MRFENIELKAFKEPHPVFDCEVVPTDELIDELHKVFTEVDLELFDGPVRNYKFRLRQNPENTTIHLWGKMNKSCYEEIELTAEENDMIIDKFLELLKEVYHKEQLNFGSKEIKELENE